MKLSSSGFTDNGRIADEFAFCVKDATTHITFSKNRNPAFSWEGAPAGTRSFVLICHDKDVPSKPDGVNQEGYVIPATLPRINFYHWTLIDIASNVTAIKEGEYCDGITVHGKPGPDAAGGTRQGVNDYTKWFASDPQMAGQYFGYDGSCPPWNDPLLHHYTFTLYALDIARCNVSGTFAAEDVLAAMQGHVLAQASIVGVYSLNPEVKF